jgi:glycosyltransferase involved in cell wall biosynthesis
MSVGTHDSTMNPRIMILIDTYAIGGAGKVILQFLKSGGTDVCAPVVTGFWRGPRAAWLFRDAVETLGVKFEVLVQKFAFDPLVIYDALKLTRAHKTQILESHGYKGHVVCLALKRWTGLPWIAYVHGWTSENKKVALYNQLDRSIVRFADRVVAVSGAVSSRVRIPKRAQKKIVVINNAADPANCGDGINARDSLKVSNDDVLVGVVGRLSPEKGQRYLLEAIHLIPPDVPLKAVLVGDGQEYKTLSEEIAKRNLSGRVMMVGFQADVTPFYRACDIIALPSLAEGMPNAALEAMSFGRAIVATDVGGIPEVVIDGETGLLVPPRNPEALAAALTRLVSHRDQIRKLGLAGNLRAEREFNPTDRVEKVANVYREVMRHD